MKAGDFWEYTLGHLAHRKLRSWLTIIGILLGIATIVVLVAIGDGVSASVTENLESFNQDMVTVSPGGGFAFRNMEDTDSDYGKLYEKDASKVRRVMGVDEVSMSVSGNAGVSFADKETATRVTATESSIFSMFPSSYPLGKGRYFGDSESQVAVIGYGVANDMFGSDKVEVNSYIYLDSQKYKVVGILEETGSSFSGAGDSAIYIPFDDKDALFGDDLAADEIGQITVKAYGGTNTSEVAGGITSILALAHGVDEDNPDFTVTDSESTREQISGITDTLSTALLLIGLISAIVGGIGVANTMFMSVVERTKEVGILKSIGATSRQILALFILEAALVGAIGGFLGLLLGACVIYEVIPYLGLTPLLKAEVAAGAVLFSACVGIVAGILPARNASRIPAIEALSYD